MGRSARRSVVAALCAGFAMVGASVHGLLGIDAELQRSAVAAQALDHHSVRVVAPYRQDWDCPGGTSRPGSRHLS